MFNTVLFFRSFHLTVISHHSVFVDILVHELSNNILTDLQEVFVAVNNLSLGCQ